MNLLTRHALKNLIDWKSQKERPPLIVQGARQVGKTYLLRDIFGKNYFPNVHYFNFEEQTKLTTFFTKDLKPTRILEELAITQNQRINKDHDLLIFDEIQACPQALTSLKYFCEEIPEMAVVGAGSLLGLSLSPEAFPVGKVQNLQIFPLNFEEFLKAQNKPLLEEAYYQALQKSYIPESAHTQLWELLMDYYFTGGLPRVVRAYLDHGKNPEMIQP